MRYLVCVDDSLDCKVALDFAVSQVKKLLGSLTLIYVIELPEFRHWTAVEKIMLEEANKNAKKILKIISEDIQNKYSITPMLIVKNGDKLEEILKVINKKSKNKIDNLVLGVALEGSGPNRLVNSLTLELTKNITIPVTIVPENF